MRDNPPDFDELVGSDLEPAELDRLRRVHDLLVEAGPPPELTAELAAPPTPGSVHVLRHRRGALVAIAAAFGVLAFAIGFLAGGRADDYGTFRVVPMSGTGAAEGARATIEIFDADAAGNWPMEIEVIGLRPPSSGGLYQLWLTSGGRRVALCGSFLADADGSTVVPMNAPWKLSEFDGWVVVEEGTAAPVLTT
jgi:hypothetical protein